LAKKAARLDKKVKFGEKRGKSAKRSNKNAKRWVTGLLSV
jgi:hypothetical protein